MFVNHCLQLLCLGNSSIRPDQVTDHTSVMLRLYTGVRVKKLDSIKTSLLMIEVIRLSWSRSEYGSCSRESMELFDNFVSYTYGRFSRPVAMALIKYAIQDRRLSMRNVSSSRNWELIRDSFSGPLLDRSPSVSDCRTAKQFERAYKRLKCCMVISNCLHEYMENEMERYQVSSIFNLDRHLTECA